MSRRVEEKPDRSKSWWRRLAALVTRYLVPGLLVLVALSYNYVALVVHVNPPVVAIEDAHMAPTLRVGELVILAPVRAATLSKGEVIAVRVSAPTRAAYNLAPVVVQRIVRVKHTSTGLVVTTSGDNASNGVVLKTTSRDVVGRLAFVVPVLGYVFQFAQSIEGVIFFVAVVVIWLLYFLFGVIDDRRRAARVDAPVDRTRGPIANDEATLPAAGAASPETRDATPDPATAHVATEEAVLARADPLAAGVEGGRSGTKPTKKPKKTGKSATNGVDRTSPKAVKNKDKKNKKSKKKLKKGASKKK